MHTKYDSTDRPNVCSRLLTTVTRLKYYLLPLPTSQHLVRRKRYSYYHKNVSVALAAYTVNLQCTKQNTDIWSSYREVSYCSNNSAQNLVLCKYSKFVESNSYSVFDWFETRTIIRNTQWSSREWCLSKNLYVYRAVANNGPGPVSPWSLYIGPLWPTKY